jgi:hypothetical protein
MIVFTNARPTSIRAEFDHLKLKGHRVNGYVIMPNHMHVLIEFINAEKKINTIVSNGKRFLAYEIVDRLKNKKNNEILLQLAETVSLQIASGENCTRCLRDHLIVTQSQIIIFFNRSLHA